MTDDDKTKRELVAIREEMKTADESKHRALVEAYFSAAHNGMQATVDELPHLIGEYIVQRLDSYPALMDVCDGQIHRAAGHVLGLMLAFAADDIQLSIGECADHCEEVAAMHVTDLHKRGDYQGRGNFHL